MNESFSRSRRIHGTFQGGPSCVARLPMCFADGWQTNTAEIGVAPPSAPLPKHLFSVTLMRGRGVAEGEGMR